MVILALLFAVAAIVVFLAGRRWWTTHYVAVGLALLTVAWIIQTVFVNAATVTVH